VRVNIFLDLESETHLGEHFLDLESETHFGEHFLDLESNTFWRTFSGICCNQDKKMISKSLSN